jgi:hypothetical protein
MAIDDHRVTMRPTDRGGSAIDRRFRELALRRTEFQMDLFWWPAAVKFDRWRWLVVSQAGA